MSLTLTSPPAVEPVTLSEMKLQCGFGPMEDTDQIREQTLAEQLRSAVVAARQQCEAITSRAFVTQSYTFTRERFPYDSCEYGGHDRLDLTIPVPSFQSLQSFFYLDLEGVQQDQVDSTGAQVLGAWGFQLVQGGDTRPARLRPPIGRGWPQTQWQRADAVSLTFTCGFGDTPGQIPFAIRQAVKLMAEWIYRGARGEQPRAVDPLLSPYIVDIL